MNEQEQITRDQLLMHARERVCVLEDRRVAVLAQLNQIMGGLAEWRYLAEQLEAPAAVPAPEPKATE